MIKFDYSKNSSGLVITGYHGNARKVEIPETIGGIPVTAVGSHAFSSEGMAIESILVPPSVRRIGRQAFEMCISLTRLTLSEGLRFLGSGALNASEVRELYLPSTLETVEDPLSLSCRLIPSPENPVFHSDGYGFYNRRTLCCVNPFDERQEYEIEPGTEAVVPGAFSDQPFLQQLTIPASLRTIPEGTLTNVEDPFDRSDGIRRVFVHADNPYWTVTDNILYGREKGVLLRSFSAEPEAVIPEGVLRIGAGAFRRSTVRRVVFPESLREIGADAFRDSFLEQAQLPAGAIYIPHSDNFLKNELLSDFGGGGRLYSFSVYDKVLTGDHLNRDRIAMLCSRLEEKVDLTEEKENMLREYFRRRMPDAVSVLAETEEIGLLRRLEKLSFLTRDNLPGLIAQVNRTGHRQTLAFLLSCQHRNGSADSFDFSL